MSPLWQAPRRDLDPYDGFRIVVLPIMFTYPFFQRFFVKGMMLGAVKG